MTRRSVAHRLVVAGSLVLAAACTHVQAPEKAPTMMKRLTPVLYVEEIEPCLSFWTDLGYEVTDEVPEGDVLGFVILQRDDVQVMYQTRTSVANDVPELADEVMQGPAALFIEVESADWVAERLEEGRQVVPRRQTFYGADELIVRAPCGTLVTFAEFGEASGEAID